MFFLVFQRRSRVKFETNEAKGKIAGNGEALSSNSSGRVLHVRHSGAAERGPFGNFEHSLIKQFKSLAFHSSNWTKKWTAFDVRLVSVVFRHFRTSFLENVVDRFLQFCEFWGDHDVWK